ncbi:MAG: Fe-S cluster assembly protein SufD [Dehalococcoidia bacterium]|nr:Fe-S cluster assembly protein SufD [Dehalococcoidia bacterium]
MSSIKPLNKFNSIFSKNIILNDDIKKLKQNAWDLFNKSGLPPSTNTTELWKYTNFSDLKKIDFDNSYKNDFLVKDNINILKNDQWNNIFIINGFFDESQSNFSNEIVVENFSNLDKLKYLSNKIGSIADDSENEFISLNSSLMQDPVIISIDDQKAIKNINIVMITVDQNSNFCNFPRVFVEAKPKTNSTVVETYINLSDVESKNLTIPVVEYLLEEDSKLNHKHIQLDSGKSFLFHFDRILQKRNSNFISTSYSNAGFLSRYDIHSNLNGIDSNCNFHGLYITDKKQQQENEISITHSVPKCSSDQMFKGILAGESKAVFSGKVLVKKDAQKTKAFQKDLNFLLSKKAEVNTKPSLEIYADDVECSHGATAGNMDNNMLFYLQSRGINEDEATSMLIRGFAQEIIEEFDDENIINFLGNILNNKIKKLDIEGII